jgi:short-subunit dehydrogenase involved in D-alanine esterification of teichoic acids
VEKVWKDIITKFKKVNILINNAAIARGKLLKDLPFE